MVKRKISNNCWYAANCPQVNADCEMDCEKNKEMKFLIANCGLVNADELAQTKLIPAPEEEQEYEELQGIRVNITDFVNSGENLFISSKETQVGKTTWSTKLMLRYFNDIWFENNLKISGYLIHVPTFLNKARFFEYQNTDEFELTEANIKEANLVIWDDITSLRLSDTLQGIMNTYIDFRFLMKKSNIFNGLLIPDMSTQLGKKLADRLIKDSIHIQLQGENIHERKEV